MHINCKINVTKIQKVVLKQKCRTIRRVLAHKYVPVRRFIESNIPAVTHAVQL